MNYQQELLDQLVESIKQAGLRVFVANEGKAGFLTYGFFTDGIRTVSFGLDFGLWRFSGNYRTACPKATGTGWVIKDQTDAKSEDFQSLLNQNAPKWAVGKHKVLEYLTPDSLIKRYPASKYVEV